MASSEKLQKDLAEHTEWNRTLAAERTEILAERTEILGNYQALETETSELRMHLQSCLHQLHLTEVQLSERTRWAQEMEHQIRHLTADLNALFGSLAYRIGKRIGLSPVPPSDPKARR
jgi:chromosome segregation ATPase